MEHFTPWSSLIGGGLIGLGATLLYASHGRFAGISSVLGAVLTAPKKAGTWRWGFLAGLLLTGVIMAIAAPQLFPSAAPVGGLTLATAGLLVGFGTRLGGGCTSGHGICGNSQLSTRSMVATVTFIATGALTVFVTHHLGGLS